MVLAVAESFADCLLRAFAFKYPKVSVFQRRYSGRLGLLPLGEEGSIEDHACTDIESVQGKMMSTRNVRPVRPTALSTSAAPSPIISEIASDPAT